MKSYFLILTFLLFLVGCEKSGSSNTDTNENGYSHDRTLLIYMAADNNLYSYSTTNLTAMRTAIAKGDTEGTNIVIYRDSPYTECATIFLLGADSDSDQLLYEYETGHNSASKEVLADVIDRTLSFYDDSEKYSLILWSHASGWMPQEASVKSFSLLSTGQSTYNYNGLEVPNDYYDYPMTKSFGSAEYNDIDYEINIPDLAEAIPSGVFDYILFDCCYMGSVEVAYELRDKADYIIGSPTEIMADGMPYINIMDDLSGLNPDLEQVCEDYYNYYNSLSGYSQSATIGLYNTSKLEDLAECYATLIENNYDKVKTIGTTGLQCYDRYTQHFIYDLRNYAEQFCTTSELETLDAAINECVVTKFNTSSFITITISDFCGISSYVFNALSSNNSYANEYYFSNLEWSKAIGVESYLQ